MSSHAPTVRWIAIGLALTGLACGDSGSGGTAPAPPAPPTTPPPVPTKPAPAPPAEPAGGTQTPADAAAGAAIYATYCAACHGATGDGDTPFAQALDPPPTAHSNGTYMNALTNDYLFKLIQEGGAAVGKSANMAPWGGTLSDAQIRDVIAHIRSLAKPPYVAPTS
jgi:mono/diheme cytochrome c family protein